MLSMGINLLQCNTWYILLSEPRLMPSKFDGCFRLLFGRFRLITESDSFQGGSHYREVAAFRRSIASFLTANNC